jgi:GxxExxY protein
MNLASAGRRNRNQEREKELRKQGWHPERKVHPDTSDDADRADKTCVGRGSWMVARLLEEIEFGMARGELIHERTTHSVIGAFFQVYNALGFGFLEAVYASALERELRDRGHKVGREVLAPVRYKGELVARQRLDMLVDEKLVVEVKSTYELHGAAPRQVYNYLRGTGLRLGLLLHFGPTPKFYRILCHQPSTSSSTLIYPHDPRHPKYPDEPSVLDAGPAYAVDRPAIVGGRADSDDPDDVDDADSTGSP